MDIPRKNEIPDWVYKTDISKVKTSNTKRISLNQSEWKEFRFGDYISEIYKASVMENCRRYDVNSSLLCGGITAEDRVSKRQVKSLREEQIMLPDC